MGKLIIVISLFTIMNSAICQNLKRNTEATPSTEKKVHWIPFNWDGDTISGRYYEKGFMTVPVSFDKLPYQFTMQLDLGAVTTEVYGNSIAAYLEKHKGLKSKITNDTTYTSNGEQNPMFKGVRLKLGSVSFGDRYLGYYKNYGDTIPLDSVNTKSVKHIGTIAPDIFKDKILIIDYQHQRLAVVEELPLQFSKAYFQDCEIEDGRIKIPFIINGKNEKLLFDTGSSLFALITTKERASWISNGNVVDSLNVNSWGDRLTIYGCKVSSDIVFGQKTLGPTVVYYDKPNIFKDFYNRENIWGITGNAYFLDNTIIIDYKGHRFGIM